MAKLNVVLKTKHNEDWDSLLNSLVNGGMDFFTEDGISTINIFLKDESGFSLSIRKDGTWKLQ